MASTSIASIRRFCLDCQGGSSRAVRECPDAECRLHDWRLAAPEGVSGEEAARAARRAVRRHCLLCAGSRTDVRRCTARDDCPLWRYRFGVRPQTYRLVRRRFFAPRPLSLLPGLPACGQNRALLK